MRKVYPGLAKRQPDVEPPIEKRRLAQGRTPRRRRELGATPLAITARSVNERVHVSHFLHTVLRPDPSASTSLRRLNAAYPIWCLEQGVDQLEPAALGVQLRAILDAIGLKCEPVDGDEDVLIRGARLDGRWLSERVQQADDAARSGIGGGRAHAAVREFGSAREWKDVQ